MQRIVIVLLGLASLVASGVIYDTTGQMSYINQEDLGRQYVQGLRTAEGHTMTKDEVVRQKLILDVLYRVYQPLQQKYLVMLDDRTKVCDEDLYIRPLTREMLMVLDMIRNNQMLGKQSICRIHNALHMKQMVGLYRLLVAARDFDALTRLMVYARQHINTEMYVYTLVVALGERDDTQKLIVPALHEIVPQIYYEDRIIQQIQQLDTGHSTLRPQLRDIIGLGRQNRVKGGLIDYVLNRSPLWQPLREIRRKIMVGNIERQDVTEKGYTVIDLPGEGLLAEDIGLKSYVNVLISELIVNQDAVRNSLRNYMGRTGLYDNEIPYQRGSRRDYTDRLRYVSRRPRYVDAMDLNNMYVGRRLGYNSRDKDLLIGEKRYGNRRSGREDMQEEENGINTVSLNDARLLFVGRRHKDPTSAVNIGSYYNEDDRYYNKDDRYYNKDDRYYNKDDCYYNQDNRYYNKDDCYYNKDDSYYNQDDRYYSKDDSYYNKYDRYYNKDDRYYNQDDRYYNKDASYYNKYDRYYNKYDSYYNKDDSYYNKDDPYYNQDDSYYNEQREYQRGMWKNRNNDYGDYYGNSRINYEEDQDNERNYLYRDNQDRKYGQSRGHRYHRSIGTHEIEMHTSTSSAGRLVLHTIQQLVARLNVERIALGLPELIDDTDTNMVRSALLNTKVAKDLGLNYGDMYGDVSTQTINKIENIIQHLDATLQHRIHEISSLTYHQQINEIGLMLAGQIEDISLIDCLGDILKDSQLEQQNRKGSVPNILENEAVQVFLAGIVKVVDYHVYGLTRQNEHIPYHDNDITIQQVDVDQLQTYLEYDHIDLSNLQQSSYQGQRRQIVGRVPRLNHKDFNIRVDVTSNRPQEVVVRQLLVPAVDGTGNRIPLKAKRQNAIVLNIYTVELQQGHNTLNLNSNEITWTADETTSLTEIYQKVMQALNGDTQVQRDVLVGQTKRMPHRLVLPRGRVNGLPMQLITVITPVDTIDAREMKYRRTAIQDDLETLLHDRLPLYYPLDCYITDLQQINSMPNVIVKDVKIYHGDDIKMHLNY